jgi:NADH dehydrogenase [ubiquinone] 1 alpha subcomplex assembly factor 7
MILKKIIKVKKLFLDQYINYCLYKFDTSYYQSKNIFGYKGDFVTSPHISSIFSEMLAFWTFSYWDKIKKPKDLNILELGPGDGTMAKDIITTLKKRKQVNGKINYFFLEKSKYLKKKQKEKLIHLNNIYWIKNIKDFQKNNLVILSNEFFDALPVKQFIKKKNKWLEKGVQFNRKTNKLQFFFEPASQVHIKKISHYFDLEKNNFIEICYEAKKIVKDLSLLLQKENSIFLTIDYGDFSTFSNDTLQAIKNRKKVDPLTFPGESDLTTHVNFYYLIKLFNEYNLHKIFFINQSQFLQKLGINERLASQSKLLNSKKLFNLKQSIKRLIHPKEMGNLFKVLVIGNKKQKFDLGK